MNSPTATLETPPARTSPAAPSISAKRPIKIALADYHAGESFLVVQGRSSKEYRFDYNKGLQRFIYETAEQEDVDDLFRANGMYGFFTVSAVVEDAPPVTDAAKDIAALNASLDEVAADHLKAVNEADALRAELLETRAKLHEAERALKKAQAGKPAKGDKPDNQPPK